MLNNEALMNIKALKSTKKSWSIHNL